MYGIQKLEQLNTILELSSVSPVKECHIPLTSALGTQKTRYIDKAIKVFSLVCESICPGEGDELQSLVCRSVNPASRSPVLDDTSKILIDVYRTAETWTSKRQVLSILSQIYSFQDVKSVSNSV